MNNYHFIYPLFISQILIPVAEFSKNNYPITFIKF